MIILSQKQMREMAKNICEQQDGNLIMCFNGNEVEIDYYLDYDESIEDDYENGTGASIVENVQFSINGIICYDDEVFFDEQRLCNMVNEYLTA